MTFAEPNYTLLANQTNFVRGTFTYSRKESTATMATDGTIPWWFTFEEPGFGTLRRELRNQDGTRVTENGRFTAE
jgi:hypothetical protein